MPALFARDAARISNKNAAMHKRAYMRRLGIVSLLLLFVLVAARQAVAEPQSGSGILSGVVIGPVKAPLTQVLRLDPRWRLTYEDKLAAVFVRNK